MNCKKKKKQKHTKMKRHQLCLSGLKHDGDDEEEQMLVESICMLLRVGVE